jgi:sulfoquinovose isomerase
MTLSVEVSIDACSLASVSHRDWLKAEADRQFGFFAAALNPKGGFFQLAVDGTPLPDRTQELHATARMVHSFALATKRGRKGAADMVDHGMRALWYLHRDPLYGGYVWAVDGREITDGRKLAYGHVFVLLAAASAMEVGHPDAARLMRDVLEVLDRRFWEDGPGLYRDEWNRDWTPFSIYRGMNANMHAVEALLSAFEATGEAVHLARAGRILDKFTVQIAPVEGWHIPEHFTEDWKIDRAYAGNPMFRPAGTTPGHSLEFARLLLQWWDLSGRQGDAPDRARSLWHQALTDGWLLGTGGFAYTLDFDRKVAISNRYWWPVTEAIGTAAMLLKADPHTGDDDWYRILWQFAQTHLIDHVHGGWFPEIGPDGKSASSIFRGKPDIYHSIQAALFPLTPGISRHLAHLGAI